MGKRNKIRGGGGGGNKQVLEFQHKIWGGENQKKNK